MEIWLWGAVIAALLESLGCPGGKVFETCVTVGNLVVLPFEVFPKAVMTPLVFAKVPNPVAWACVIACGLASHWLMRRFLPTRLLLLQAGLLLVGAFVLNFGIDLYAFWDLFHRPPVLKTLLSVFSG